MPHPYSRYRLRFLQDVVRIFIVPSAALSLVLTTARVSLGWFAPPAYLAFVLLAATIRDRYDQWSQEKEAHRMGARLAPQVKGKWPGNLDILLKIKSGARSDYLSQVYLDLFNEYQSTTLNLRLLGANLMITMDEEHIKFLAATGFSHFWRGKLQKERMETFLGDGIFNRDDELWKAHRTMARPFFSRDRVKDFQVFERHTEHTLSVISSITSTNAPVEVQDLFSRFTLDAAAEALLGEKTNSLKGSLPVPGQSFGNMSVRGAHPNDDFGMFAQAFDTSQEVILGRTHKGYFWPATQLFKDDLQPHADRISEWLAPMISRVLENKSQMRKAGLTCNADQNTFLEYLADNTEDPKVIRDQLLNILLAGRDTTAALLTYVTYMMSMHPDIARKMRAEVLKQFGTNQAPTFEGIKSLRYMHAVINETLRLFPPVPHNVRESREKPVLLPKSDPTFPTSPGEDVPIYMPGNTPIMFAPILVHRNPALWGPDAHAFDPERWLDERLSRFIDNPMMFVPFHAGPRICIGQSYARNEASYFLVRLLQQFDTFTLAPEAQPEGSLPPPEWQNATGRKKVERIRPSIGITLYVKGGLWVRFGKAAEA